MPNNNPRDDAERMAREIVSTIEERISADGWSEWARQTLTDLVVPLVAPALARRDAALGDRVAATDEVVEAARKLVRSPKFPRTTHEMLQDHYELVEALARLDAIERGEHAQPEPARREGGE